MLSRALIFAAVTLLVSCLASPAAWAQAQNLEAGKSPSQLFAGTCTACHKSPRGLLKTISAGALPGFLKEHYTTSGDMASQLATFLISNGASDNRQAKQGADAKPAAAADQSDRQGRRPRNAPSQEVARPDAENPSQAEGGRQGRKRLGRPSEGQEEARPVSDAPAQAAVERGPDGRKLAPKQPLGKRAKPGVEEAPATARDEPPKAGPDLSDQAKEQIKGEPGKAESAATEHGKPDAEAKASEAQSSAAKPSNAKSDETKPDAVRTDSSGGENPPVARRDPVPPATSAPTSVAVTPPAAASGPSDAAASARQMPAVAPEAPAVTASAPPPPASAGPPAPPISQ